MFILQYKFIDVIDFLKNDDIIIFQRARGRVEEKLSKNRIILYFLQYGYSCKIVDERTFLGVENEFIYAEEQMTIDDCGGRREDIDSVEIINRINGDNGMIDMNEEERN